MGQREEMQDRDRGIVRTGIIGIVANVLLAGFKAVVGVLSNSIAIVLDAVNNLSDALSSVITIVGTKLANKPADRKHPYGHGRTEYITTIVIAAIVTWAGVTSLTESVERILHPEPASYEALTLAIVAVAVAAKIGLGLFTKSQGERLHSDSLVASGTDALMDAIISTSTLVAALIYLFAGVSVEAWLGAVISVIIIKSGVDILREAISHILGERVDSELSQGIRHTVEHVPGVQGAYDLLLNDYGPDRLSGSVHVEVDEGMTAREIDTLTRAVQLAVMQEHGIILHTIGIYSANASDGGDIGAIRSSLLTWADEDEYVLQVHGFYADVEAKQVTFDLVVSWDAPNRHDVLNGYLERLRQLYPDYTFVANLDSDMSD
jgi:cation diffusion facilitator family transporter